MTTNQDHNGAASRSSLIEFPCRFPIKVMGANVEGFEATMLELLRDLEADVDPAAVERRPSRTGQYMGLTVHVWARHQPHLDDLYRALSGHPMVKVVL